MSKYLLSIVIPTRNREVYANLTIRQILGFCNGEIEVVIQDNGDDESLKELLSDVLDRNDLVYNYESELLSFVDNFDHGLNNATGEYVIMIGDDDGITSKLLPMVRWAKENNIESVKPNLNVVYFWPGSKVYREEKDTGILKITNSTGCIRHRNPRKVVIKLLSNSCQNYLDMDLVKIYHGFVKRSLLINIKEKTGKFVGGLSPDIYLSVALSLVLKNKLVSIQVPLTISGICNVSGSSASSTGAHTGALKDAPHLKGHNNYEWNKKIPAFYSVETIWADSALAAVRDIAPELEKYYKFDKMLDVAKKKYPEFLKIAEKNYIDYKGSNFKHCFWKVENFFNRAKKSVKYRTTNNKTKEWDKIQDINIASKVIEEYLHDLYLEFHKRKE